MAQENWFIYIVKCADDSLYTGITTHVERRIQQHNQGTLGAKYTKTRRPVVEVYRESAKSRSEASQREYQIKQLSKTQKLALINAKSKSAES